MDSNVKCPNCKENYVRDIREPLILSCGYSTCQICLNDLIKMSSNKDSVTCPDCGVKNIKFQKNNALIQALIHDKVPSYLLPFAPAQSVISEIPSGSYRIKSKLSGKYLQIRGGSKDKMAALVQDEKIDQAVFNITKSGESYMIHSQHSFKAIQAPAFSVDEKWGVLVQDDFDNSDHQLWIFEKHHDGTYSIVNKKNKKCMDIDYKKKDNGAQVIFYDKKPFEKAENQHFTLELVAN